MDDQTRQLTSMLETFSLDDDYTAACATHEHGEDRCNETPLPLTPMDKTLLLFRLSEWMPGHTHVKAALRATIAAHITAANAVALMKAVTNVLDRLIPNLSTLDGFMTRLRKDVEATLCNADRQDEWKEVQFIVVIRRKYRARIRQVQQERVLYKNEHQLEVDYADVVLAFKRLYAMSDNPFAQVLVVQLATGARMIEALQVSRFVRLPARPRHVHVVGVAKTTDHREIIRPLLFVSIDELMARVAVVRGHVASERVRRNIGDASKLSTCYNSKVNALLKTVLPSFTSHRCRELYANATYHFHGGSTSRTAFISRTLGHKIGFLSSALHYQGMNILGLPLQPPRIDVARVVHVVTGRPHVVMEDASGELQSFARHVPKQHMLPSSDVMLTHENRLVNCNVAPTPAHLVALGFGRRTVDAHRKRMRDVDDSSLVAMVQDRTGTRRRISRNPKKRDGRVQQRLLLVIVELQENNVEVNDRTLRGLGFSARTLLGWRRAKKGA